MPQQNVSTPDIRTASEAQLTRGTWLGGILLGLVVLAPLPLGSNRPLWWSLLAVAIGALLFVYALNLLRRKADHSLGLGALLGIVVPYLAVLAWAAFQALPIVPEAWRHPLWEAAANALPSAPPGTISLSPDQSLVGLMRLALYGGVFWLFVQFGRERRYADLTLRVLAYAGFAYALYGLVIDATNIERILWLRKWAYEGFLTSTFVNRNSYATYAGLGLLCAGALLFDRVRDVLGLEARLKDKIRLMIEVVSRQAWFPLLMVAIIAMALLRSGSRAGAVSAGCGIVVFVVAVGHAQLLRWRQALIALLLLGAAAVAVFSVSGTKIIARVALLDEDEGARREIYELALDALNDAPLLGSGLGTFPDIFNLYRAESFDKFGTVSRAHNSYLENALELGVPATVLLLASLAAIGEASFVGLRRRRRGRLFPALGLSALALVAVHSAVDFSLEIPAVAVSFAAIAGIGCAQSFRSRKEKRSAGA